MSGELEHKLVEIISQLQHQAPVATNAVLQSARVDAIASFMYIPVCAIIAAGALAALHKWVWPEYKIDPDSFVSFFGPPVCIAIVFLCALVSILQIFDVWNYVALFHPDLYIAHQLLSKVRG